MAERHFLDWTRPLLPAAADWLLGLGDDLSRVDVLCAGQRASRVLLERLVTASAARNHPFDPPEILTPAHWLDRRVRATDIATELEVELAWRTALGEAAPEIHRALGSPSTTPLAWASRLAQLERELGREELGFADAARQIANMDVGDREHARWQALATLERDVRERLVRAGRLDPLTARLSATPGEGRRVVLVGLVELPKTARRLVESLPDAVALVHAPPERADDFDAMGLPLLERWEEARLPLERKQIHVAEDPVRSAARCARRLAERAEELGDRRPAAEEITVGVVDEECVAPLQEMFPARGLPVRDARGTPAARQPVLRALRAVERLLRDDDFDALLDFVREPAVESRLRGADDESPLVALHRFRADHLPERVGLRQGGDERGAPIPQLGEIRIILGDLLDARRPLSRWPEPIANALASLLRDEPLSPEHPGGRHSVQLLTQLREILDTLSRTPQELDLTLSSDEALALVADRLERVALPRLPERGSVELVGWLELAHDDAEHIFLLGANEGLLPASNSVDPFLPESLRGRLGLPDGRARYARDLYWLTTLLRSRTTMELFLAKRTLAGDPLLPSRLLFACEPEELPRRVEHALRAATAEGSFGSGWVPAEEDDPRVRQAPDLSGWLKPLEHISVTAFADYLTSPYRFHLRHRLDLRDRSPNAVGELDAASFGTLLHEVLRRFGESGFRDSTDERQIRDALRGALFDLTEKRFGARPHATLRLQFATARERLDHFAAWQAQRAAAGWRIQRVEFQVDPRHASLDVDEEAIELRARIDRLDRHADGRLAVMDYKARDGARPEQLDPRRTHTKTTSGEWKDLQLPLYDHLVRASEGVDADAPLESAYINLTPEGCSYREVSWTREERDDALDVARGIVREIRAGVVRPPDPAAGRRFPELSSITRDGAFQEADADDEEAE